MQHRGIIEFFLFGKRIRNIFWIEQEEKESPLSLPVLNDLFDAPSIERNLGIKPFALIIYLCLKMYLIMNNEHGGLRLINYEL